MLKFMFTSTLIMVIIVSSSVIGYKVYNEINGQGIVVEASVIDDEIAKKEESVNVLILGIDELGIHTDTIVVANFNSSDNNIDLMSIPRDLKITLSSEQQAELKNVPKTMKITELFAYAGKEKGVDLTTEVVENILKEKIDFWVTVDLDGFKYLVDEIGGVDFYVPRNMKYSDPYQNLYIDLKKGQQTLNGEQAEHLIRYRSGYSNGDLGRIQVQQDFLKAMFSQLLNSSNKVNDVLAIAKTAMEYTDNNITLTDITNNIKYVDDVDISKIRSFKMPVENTNVNGKSYVEIIDDSFKDVLLEIFNPILPSDEVVSSENLNITVLNGSNTNGLANETKDLLESSGYTISDVGSFSGTKEEYTRIYVKDSTYGKDLTEFFNNYKILVNYKQDEDVKIVIGTME